MSVRNVVISVALIVLLAGCKIVPVRHIDPVRVPSNLNESQVEAAILITLGDHQAEESSLSTWEMITDNALRAALRNYNSADRSGDERYWYFEEKGEHVIYVGFMKNDLYLRLALHIGNQKIQPEIVDSKNFYQTATEIRKNAYFYVQEFDDRLQRAVGDVSKFVTYGRTASSDTGSSPKANAGTGRR